MATPKCEAVGLHKHCIHVSSACGSVPHKQVVADASHPVKGDTRWVLLRCERAAHVAQPQAERVAASWVYDELLLEPLWQDNVAATRNSVPCNDLRFAQLPLQVAHKL